jgi:hypothetical protein
MRCAEGKHYFEGMAAAGKRCLCGKTRLEMTGILDRQGRPMAKVAPMASNFEEVMGRAREAHSNQSKRSQDLSVRSTI